MQNDFVRVGARARGGRRARHDSGQPRADRLSSAPASCPSSTPSSSPSRRRCCSGSGRRRRCRRPSAAGRGTSATTRTSAASRNAPTSSTSWRPLPGEHPGREVQLRRVPRHRRSSRRCARSASSRCVVTGTVTQICVEETARQAFHHGFRTTLVQRRGLVVRARPARGDAEELRQQVRLGRRQRRGDAPARLMTVAARRSRAQSLAHRAGIYGLLAVALVARAPVRSAASRPPTTWPTSSRSRRRSAWSRSARPSSSSAG